VTAQITRPVTRGVTRPLTGDPMGGHRMSTMRPLIAGSGTSQWTMTAPITGNSMRTGGTAPWGYNLGVYEYYSVAEASSVIATLYSEGVRMVRLVGMRRWSGALTKLTGDSRMLYDNVGNFLGLADSLPHKHAPGNFQKLKVWARAVEAISNAHPTDPMWFIVCGEGDVLQGGTQDVDIYNHAVNDLAVYGEAIPGGLGDWGLAAGYNILTSNYLYGSFLDQAAEAAREFASYNWQFAFEVLSEPLPPSGTFPGDTPRHFIYPGSNGTDGVYGPNWVFRPFNANAAPYLGAYPNTGPPNGCRSIEDVMRGVIAVMRPYNPRTKYIIGGRNGYNLDPEAKEIIAALSDPGGLGGNLLAQNMIIVTWDRLGSGCNQCTKTPNTAWVISKMNCPGFQNQLGARNTGDGNKDVGDSNTYGIRHAIRTYKQWGIAGTIWDYRGNGASGYGTYAQSGGDWAGAGGTYTVTEPRHTNVIQALGESLASLEAAAIAAANAAHGVLVYVKADFSNCTKVGGGTPTFGDAISQINPVTDPDGTLIVFTTHATGTVTVDYPWKDAAASTYLPTKRPVLAMDNTSSTVNFLDASMSFFGTTANGTTATGDENFAATVAGLSTGGNGVGMDFLTCGNTGTVDFYPQITMNNSNFMVAKVIGDGPSGPTLTGTNTSGWSLQAGVPIVASIIKSGTKTNSAVTFLVNGIDDTGVVPGGYAGSATGEVLVGTGNTLTAQTVAATGIASLTRLRIGGKSNSGSFIGNIGGFCLYRGMPTLAQVRTVDRFLAALLAGGFKA
jgi:hypothetical protein